MRRLTHMIFTSAFVYVVTCQYHFQNLVVVSNLLPETCYSRGKNYIEPEEPGELPHCGDFSNEGVCSEYHNPEGKYINKTIINKPSCTNKGTFSSVQCKGEPTTGRCFCFGPQGERLFGQQWWTQAENMTCACSRHKAEMNTDDVYFNSLHCNSMGNYEELQCDAISEQCWCVEEKTGKLATPVVPQVAMQKLPCYSSITTGIQYLRQCENQKYAQKAIEHQLNLRGTTANFGDFKCDDDGGYGAYAMSEGSAFCTWRDDSKISSYRSGENTTTINCCKHPTILPGGADGSGSFDGNAHNFMTLKNICHWSNCARDVKVFEEAGKTMPQKCTSEGNYDTYQTSGDVGYCVDMDGYTKSPSGIKDKKNCTDYVAYR